MKKRRLRLAAETLKSLKTEQLSPMIGGYSAFCTMPGNSLCGFYCATGPNC